jgi:multidrug efflux pump subunit AcrA (membrane-fusion protein)
VAEYPKRVKETTMSMRMTRRTAAAALAIALGCGVVAGCSDPVAEATLSDAAKVQEIEGQPSRITLLGKAGERLGVTTVAMSAGAKTGQMTVPESAVLYDADGQTFVYTNPEGSLFVRADVTVVDIAGGKATLSAGPPVGTKVVTVGAAELFGVESGLGGGH